MGGGTIGATLDFSSQDVGDEEGGLRGSFRATTIADDGAFSVNLLPGAYVVTITPADLDLAVATENVQVSVGTGASALRGQLFRVARRARLGGSVATHTQLEMAGAAVEALVVEAEGIRTRGSEAVTDETGRFALPLDVGTYDLVLRPPSRSGYAWAVAPNFEVGAVDTILAARYRIESPIPIHGVVSGDDLDTIGGLEVQAFARIDDRFIEVGRARVQDGVYELLVPAGFIE